MGVGDREVGVSSIPNTMQRLGTDHALEEGIGKAGLSQPPFSRLYTVPVDMLIL